MLLQINFKSGLPVYLQLVEQIKSAAVSGMVRPGEPLPSIRPLAEELRVNRNTVAKAYTELENQGVIETLPGKGCFVRNHVSPLKQQAKRELLSRQIDEVVVQAHHLQVGREALLDLVQERLDLLEQKQRANETEKAKIL